MSHELLARISALELFSIPFGVLLAGLGLLRLYERRLSRFPTVPGVSSHAEVEKVRDRHHRFSRFGVRVYFRYTVAATVYSANTGQPAQASGLLYREKPLALQRAAQYNFDRPVTVQYDPRAPARSWLLGTPQVLAKGAVRTVLSLYLLIAVVLMLPPG